ncbi:MAG: glutamine-hydrolyzing carbamoyl-phosphate synthase small subunit [Phycisphaerales bacterium]|nr:glutamine-hydrolyzing carbamoyl-phosphate synthase small subunit [Phycisphaerales bacterium]
MSTTTDQNRVRLALSTGEIFEGFGFGANIDGGGEVVFNTAMSGYQESLTDPSYMGQILVQTAPMIGNSGMNERDMESRKIQVSGMVVHEYVDLHSNYRASMSLDEQLKAAGVQGISGVDTRAITTLLRSGGAVQGVICGDHKQTDAQLVQRAQATGSMAGTDFASGAGSGSDGSWAQPSGQWKHLAGESDQAAIPVGVIDCGVKENILRCLVDVGCDPVVLPMTISASKIKGMLLDGSIYGVFLSNGPGDPGALAEFVSMVRELVHDDEIRSFPIYGICLGHQVLALAHGASTYKLKFGHRGINHPIVEISSGQVSITSQNHGFAVDENSCVDTGLIVTHRHLNDDTVAGLKRNDRSIAGMQYHPEASPGPHDAGAFFVRFAEEAGNTIPANECSN